MVLLATLIAGLALGTAAAEEAGPIAGSSPDTIDGAVRCACTMEISYANPERYDYWKRGRVWAEMDVELQPDQGTYRTASVKKTSFCEGVRAPRRGEPFRSIDLCLHLDQWLDRFVDEVRCTTQTDDRRTPAPGESRAQCRIPVLQAGGADFLRATGSQGTTAAAICAALDGALELRLTAEMNRLDREALHGLPDLRHIHTCRPVQAGTRTR